MDSNVLLMARLLVLWERDDVSLGYGTCLARATKKA